MVNFGPLAAEIDPVVWGTPANFWDAEMRDMKQREGNNGTKIQGWKLRETETTAQSCRGWKMRDMNIRERQSKESR